MKSILGIFVFCLSILLNTSHLIAEAAPRNEIKIKDVLKSAQEGINEARLAIVYMHFFGNEKDDQSYINDVTAHQWTREIIVEDHLSGSLIASGFSASDQPAWAQYYYQRLLIAGDKSVLADIGNLYIGTDHSFESNLHGKKYFETQILYEDWEGFENLGRLFQHGWGVEKNIKKAAALYQKAIEKGVIGSSTALGKLQETYEKPDYIKIANLYRQDALNGFRQANYRLLKLYENHKNELDMKQQDALLWHFVDQYRSIDFFNQSASILELNTKLHDGFSQDQIHKIKEKAEALWKSLSPLHQ